MDNWGMILIILALIGFGVFQHIHWSRECQKLIDKLMSRNYADYAYTKKHEQTLPATRASNQSYQVPEIDEDLAMLNRQMAGIIESV